MHGMIVAEVWKDKEGLGWVTWWRFCAWSNPDSPGFCSVAILARLLLHSVLLSEYLKPAIMKLTTLKMKLKSKVLRERLQVE